MASHIIETLYLYLLFGITKWGSAESGAINLNLKY